MNQINISRNELLLTDSYEQRFEENENVFTMNYMAVSSEEMKGGLVFSMGDAIRAEEKICFFLKDSDIERLIQAIAIYGGKVKVI